MPGRESVVPFLPAEPGLRAHVSRVAALSGRAVQTAGGTPEQILTAEWAGLLHHHPGDAAQGAGAARLLSDLGFKVPSGLLPLSARAAEVVRSMRDPEQQDPELLALIESANLFDETFEGLPYEDLSTEVAVEELLNSGMLCASFVKAVRAFRITSFGHLLEVLKALPAFSPSTDEPDARNLYPAGISDDLYGHSVRVARDASEMARELSVIGVKDGYLAGVVHDIGRMAFRGGAIKSELQAWSSLGFPATYGEFLISGTDHAALGCELLQFWSFPDSLTEAVRYHHRLELTPSLLATVLYAAEDFDESLPSSARDHLAAKRLEVSEIRRSNAAG